MDLRIFILQFTKSSLKSIQHTLFSAFSIYARACNSLLILYCMGRKKKRDFFSTAIILLRSSSIMIIKGEKVYKVFDEIAGLHMCYVM